MGQLLPLSRPELIRRLKSISFQGPYSGGRHEFMLRGIRRIILLNPHRGDIGSDLLARILRQAGITREEWETTEK